MSMLLAMGQMVSLNPLLTYSAKLLIVSALGLKNLPGPS